MLGGLMLLLLGIAAFMGASSIADWLVIVGAVLLLAGTVKVINGWAGDDPGSPPDNGDNPTDHTEDTD